MPEPRLANPAMTTPVISQGNPSTTDSTQREARIPDMIEYLINEYGKIPSLSFT